MLSCNLPTASPMSASSGTCQDATNLILRPRSGRFLFHSEPTPGASEGSVEEDHEQDLRGFLPLWFPTYGG